VELEPNERILQLKEKIQKLNVIIHEATACLEFRSSVFCSILFRTLHALNENYRKDAFKAAKSDLANIGNFLGRMEMIDEFFEIIDKFSMNADQAQLEIDACETEIKQINDQMTDDAKQQQVLDSGGSMG
jgi:lipoate-protein ligase A